MGLITPVLQLGLWYTLNSFIDLSWNEEYLLQKLIVLSFNITQKLSQQIPSISWKERDIVVAGRCIPVVHTQRNRSQISLSLLKKGAGKICPCPFDWFVEFPLVYLNAFLGCLLLEYWPASHVAASDVFFSQSWEMVKDTNQGTSHLCWEHLSI